MKRQESATLHSTLHSAYNDTCVCITTVRINRTGLCVAAGCRWQVSWNVLWNLSGADLRMNQVLLQALSSPELARACHKSILGCQKTPEMQCNWFGVANTAAALMQHMWWRVTNIPCVRSTTKNEAIQHESLRNKSQFRNGQAQNMRMSCW